MFPAQHDTDHVIALKEVRSSKASLLLLGKMDTIVSDQSLLPVFS